MKLRIIILVLLSAGTIGWLIAGNLFKTDNNISKKTNNDTALCVIELFTSEGCSSCPSADAFINDIVSGNVKTNRPVIALSFHVDYWNRLGWIDSFSKSSYSARQQNYSQHLQSETYTPQAIINGQSEAVGSDRDKILKIINNRTIENKLQNKIHINSIQNLDKTIKISYSVEGNLDGKLIAAALTEDHIISNVKRGENRGRRLLHNAVVRDFNESLLQKEGIIELKDASIKGLRQRHIVLFLQDQKNLDITAALYRSI